jgi:hypothetical protein
LFILDVADAEYAATIDLDLADRVQAEIPVFVGKRPLLYTI